MKDPQLQFKNQMEVDQVAKGRRKTNMPKEIAEEESKSPRRPNIIGNGEPSLNNFIMAPQRVEKVSVRDLE